MWVWAAQAAGPCRAYVVINQLILSDPAPVSTALVTVGPVRVIVRPAHLMSGDPGTDHMRRTGPGAVAGPSSGLNTGL